MHLSGIIPYKSPVDRLLMYADRRCRNQCFFGGGDSTEDLESYTINLALILPLLHELLFMSKSSKRAFSEGLS